METSAEFEPLEKVNYYTLLFGEDLENIKKLILKFTEEVNAKEIFLTKYNNNILIRTVFIKNYLSEDIIEGIFKIFEFKDFKKYQILNIVPLEYFFIFVKNMKKLKIDQDLFLVQDKQGNTPLHKIINHTIKQSIIVPIWQHINRSTKNKLYKITNYQGYTIYDLAKFYDIKLS
jgi:hypothetical protein